MVLSRGDDKHITEFLPSMPEFSHLWWRPSAGLWFGAGAGNSDGDDGGEGGMVVGGFEIQIGVLLGLVAGFGKKWGLYTGLMGAIALIPLFGMGFIGVPLGVHYKKKFGIGLIFPVQMTNWWVALIAGVLLFTVPLLLKNRL